MFNDQKWDNLFLMIELVTCFVCGILVVVNSLFAVPAILSGIALGLNIRRGSSG